jgi:hypothetical protein
VGEGALEQGHAVLDGLARHPVLGPGQVAAGHRRGHRDQLGVEVDPLVGDGVEQDGRGAHGQAAAARGERARGEGAGCAVVDAGADLDRRVQAQVGGDPRQERADDLVDGDQGRQLVDVHAGQGHQLVVVAGRVERPVVDQLRREHGVLGRHRPPGQAGHDEVHGLEVEGRRRVHLRAVELEVQEVTEGEPAADRRDAMDLHESLEGVGVVAHDRPGVVGPPLVPVHEHRRHGHEVGVDRDDRRVLRAHADGPDRRIGHLAHGLDHRGPERGRVLLGHLAVPPGGQGPLAGGLQPPGRVDSGDLDVG